MTAPPKDLSLDEAALEYSTYKPNEPHEGLNIPANDQYVGFKAGAAYQAGVEEKRAQVLAEARAEIERLKIDCDSWKRAHKISSEAGGETITNRDQQIEIYEKALKFYADGSNWREHEPGNRPAGMTYKQRITSRDSSHIGPNQYDFGGGKKARGALTEAGKLRGKE